MQTPNTQNIPQQPIPTPLPVEKKVLNPMVILLTGLLIGGVVTAGVFLGVGYLDDEESNEVNSSSSVEETVSSEDISSSSEMDNIFSYELSDGKFFTISHGDQYEIVSTQEFDPTHVTTNSIMINKLNENQLTMMIGTLEARDNELMNKEILTNEDPNINYLLRLSVNQCSQFSESDINKVNVNNKEVYYGFKTFECALSPTDEEMETFSTSMYLFEIEDYVVFIHSNDNFTDEEVRELISEMEIE